MTSIAVFSWSTTTLKPTHSLSLSGVVFFRKVEVRIGQYSNEFLQTDYDNLKLTAIKTATDSLELPDKSSLKVFCVVLYHVDEEGDKILIDPDDFSSCIKCLARMRSPRTIHVKILADVVPLSELKPFQDSSSSPENPSETTIQTRREEKESAPSKRFIDDAQAAATIRSTSEVTRAAAIVSQVACRIVTAILPHGIGSEDGKDLAVIKAGPTTPATNDTVASTLGSNIDKIAEAVKAMNAALGRKGKKAIIVDDASSKSSWDKVDTGDEQHTSNPMVPGFGIDSDRISSLELDSTEVNLDNVAGLLDSTLVDMTDAIDVIGSFGLKDAVGGSTNTQQQQEQIQQPGTGGDSSSSSSNSSNSSNCTGSRNIESESSRSIQPHNRRRCQGDRQRITEFWNTDSEQNDNDGGGEDDEYTEDENGASSSVDESSIEYEEDELAVKLCSKKKTAASKEQQAKEAITIISSDSESEGSDTSSC